MSTLTHLSVLIAAIQFAVTDINKNRTDFNFLSKSNKPQFCKIKISENSKHGNREYSHTNTRCTTIFLF